MDGVVGVGVVDDGREEAAVVEGFDERRDGVNVVGGGDEAEDVFGGGKSLSNQVGELVDGEGLEETRVDVWRADVDVLAVDALEVAMGEEDVADAMSADERGFFAKMATDGGDL